MASKATRARRKRQENKRYQSKAERKQLYEDGRADGHREGRFQARQELTQRFVSPGRREGMLDDPFCLNQKPERPYAEVCIQPTSISDYSVMLHVERAIFEAKKFCWEHSSGARVVWWSWEHRGITG